MARYQNPILPGFYPDPTVCRVGEDYYLVTSTFTVFPGLPIFHSKDLANWEQIGHVWHRPDQLSIKAPRHSGGLYAPTLRFIRDTFILVCTNVEGGGHFYMTATNPKGPWSEAVYLEGAGIDPDIFEDQDGRIWFSATRGQVNERYWGDNEIWVREFDWETGALVGPDTVIWEGYARADMWMEAPHIYYRAPYYYLITAEGGTDFEHAVMVARASSVLGPYEACPHNPILTHRHLGRSFPVVNVGHADLVSTPNDEWYIFALASRPYGGYYRNLGRETFMGQVTWEDNWPVVNAGHGRLLESGKTSLPAFEDENKRDYSLNIDFANDQLDLNLITIRGSQMGCGVVHEAEHKQLLLYPSTAKLDRPVAASAIFLRQRGRKCVFSCDLTMPQMDAEIGVTAFHDDLHHYKLAFHASSLKLYVCQSGETHLLEEKSVLFAHKLRFEIHVDEQEYRFFARVGDKWHEMHHVVDGRLLTPDVSGSFVGTMLGIYAQAEVDLNTPVAVKSIVYLDKCTS